MTLITYETAQEEILERFKALWDPTSHPVEYENVAQISGQTIPPTTDTPWARVQVRHAEGAQFTLGASSANRRYNRTGTLTVQIFTTIGKGAVLGLQLAELIVAGFEPHSTTSGISFFNVRTAEIGSDGSWFQVQAIAEFEYVSTR